MGDYNEANLAKVIASIEASFDTIDLLINNASIFKTDTYITTDDTICYNDLTFIHMQMPFLLMNALQGPLAKARGNIISITDIYSDNPNSEFSLYCSTKAGLKSLTLSAAKKWAPRIRANCIQPGPLKFLPTHTETEKDSVLKETLLPFEGGFDPVFQTVEFIVDNNYITGQCINVDGGRSLVRS
jgi:dihydromonapterin reductase/dihydrofolate reductase